MMLLDFHYHGKHGHAHYAPGIPHTHLLRGICLKEECKDYPRHDIHPIRAKEVPDVNDEP